MVDNAPEKPAWLAAAVATSGPQAGFALGALLSAAVELPESDVHAVFGSFVACFALLALALIPSRETMRRRPGVLRSFVPRLSVSRPVVSLLPVCCSAFMGAWAVGGFFQTFSSSSVSSMSFGSSDTIHAAVVIALFMGSSVLGGPLVGRLRPRTAQLVGMVMLLAGVSALLWSVVSTNAFLLLASVFVCGVSQAAAYSGAMRRVLQRVRREESAGTLSAVSLLSYMGALTPNLVIGMFGGSWSFLAVVSGYVVLVAGCCTLSFVLPPHGDRGSAGRALD